jgi:hypothetical protein
MLFVLHHPKGALMFAANDRDQVVQWSERQLGEDAVLATIFESDERECIEKDGTGIRASDAWGCQPVLSITASMEGGRRHANDESLEMDSYMSGMCVAGRKPVLH